MRPFAQVAVSIMVLSLIGPCPLFPQSKPATVPSGSFMAAPGSPYPRPLADTVVLSGDFDGDGITDIALVENPNRVIRVLSGVGTGRFTDTPRPAFPIGEGRLFIISSDFNGDGKADLAIMLIGETGQGTLSILLSNGRGGFSESFRRILPGVWPGVKILAAQLNGDGYPDLAIVGLYSLTILIGDGSGGMSLGTGFADVSRFLGPGGLTAGDFNGDGHQDLAITSDALTVLLGDGSGGFALAPGGPILVTGDVTSGDFNGDGRMDLAVLCGCGKTAHILLGDGTGGFAETTDPRDDGFEFRYGIATTDLDGDGNLDLMFRNSTGIVIWRGRGDGTFLPRELYPLPAGYAGISPRIGDFNRDGRPDVAIAGSGETGTTELSILLGSSAKTAVSLTVTTPSASEPGTFRLQAFVEPSPAFAKPMGTVRFFDENTLLDRVPVLGGLAETRAILATGSHTLSAIYDGDQRTSSAASESLNVTIDSAAKTAQKVFLTSVTDIAFDRSPIRLYAFSASNSGIPIILSVVSGPALLQGNSLTFQGVGRIVIMASQDGNNRYLAAIPVTSSFTVSQATQTILPGPLSGTSFGSPSFKLGANASSGLPVSYSLLSGPLTLDGENASSTGTGVALIRASQGGDSRYLPAPPVTLTLPVLQADQYISAFPPIKTRWVGDTPFPVAATASSGLPVTFQVSGPATISGNLLRVTGEGLVTVSAEQQGNANYRSATARTKSFNVLPDRPLIAAIWNAASYGAWSIGAYTVVFGRGLSSVTLQAPGSPVPRLGDVTITFNTKDGRTFPADIYYVSPTQVNFITPPGLPPNQETTGTLSNSGAVLVLPFAGVISPYSPGIFTADGSGSGPPAGFAVTVASDGSSSTLPLFRCAASPFTCIPNPIPLGPPGTKVYLSLYVTGLRGFSSSANLTASVGGVPASIVYAGPQGNFPALDQLNLLVDPFTGPRTVDLRLAFDGLEANPVRLQFR
jgi:uncharacterized protein (TIGR03437 family)